MEILWTLFQLRRVVVEMDGNVFAEEELMPSLNIL